MTGAATSPVTAIARGVADGRLRAVDLVQEALRRIERDDGAINAVVALRADEAVEEAAALDQAIAAGLPTGALAGVPILIKDMEDVAGMRTTFGSLLFADAPLATFDGPVPAKLRAAGAIVVGKTNLPEFATEGYTDNRLFGATNNPWAPGRSPGGSSGGSAAAMAAGMIPFATATDGGGSVRIPAAFCGLVDMKPTLGVIPRYPPHDWIDLSSPGPFATTVTDLRLLLSVEADIGIAGDPSAFPATMAGRSTGPPTRLFAAYRTSDLGPLPIGVTHLFDAAVDAMADLLELAVTWIEPGRLFSDGDPDLDWFTLASAEHVAALGRDRVTEGFDRLHPATRSFLGFGLAIGIDEYLAARRRRFHHVLRLDDLLGRTDLLLTPSVASEGWYADGRLGATDTPGQLPPTVYSTAVQNVTGHPAISLPAGMSDIGVPFGLQVTGPRYADALLLDVAEAWERARPWPLVAPGYAPFGLDAA